MSTGLIFVMKRFGIGSVVLVQNLQAKGKAKLKLAVALGRGIRQNQP
jgi:hypothetical protein